MTFNVGSIAKTFVAWGRLLRLSLTTTVLADVIGGALFAGHGWPAVPSRLWLPVLASLCVYHGSMALNDWVDCDRDFKTRPDRPIPSLAVSQEAALSVAIVLLALGPLLANWYPGTAPLSLLVAGIAVLAVVYNLWGRGPWTGPVLLGLCRAGNLMTGMIAFGERTTACTVVALGYGVYVFLVARLGRMEDGEQAQIGMRPKPLLVGAGVCQLVPLVAGLFASPSVLAATAPIAAGWLGWLGWKTPAWSRGTVMEAMGTSLRLLIFYTASLAWIGAGPEYGLGFLAVGFSVSWLLRQVFPPS